MKKIFKSAVVFLLFLGVGLNFGCSGNKRIEGTDAPGQPAAAAAPTPVPSDSYTVQKGDSLWSISGKSKIYGDPFSWPLLFKANRDTIQDPDLISTEQVLKVDKDVSDSEKSHARDLSSKTPKYKPHSQPRATLPLDYF
jgi:LysM repeat protein